MNPLFRFFFFYVASSFIVEWKEEQVFSGGGDMAVLSIAKKVDYLNSKRMRKLLSITCPRVCFVQYE